VRGGSEYKLGIFISEVDKGGVAEKAGLQVGDLIVSVNNTSFVDISHAIAINHLQSTEVLQLKFRRTGAVPMKSMPAVKTGWVSTATEGAKARVRTIDNKGAMSIGTVRVFRQEFTLEDAIGSHACSLEANTRVTNGIPLGSSLHLPVCTVNCVQTL
jgi:C-terminal processing protease CtpA/Prc